jgi:hypothetical protein
MSPNLRVCVHLIDDPQCHIAARKSDMLVPPVTCACHLGDSPVTVFKTPWLLLHNDPGREPGG